MECLKYSPLGLALALPASIRIDKRGLPGSNTLAYSAIRKYGLKLFEMGPSGLADYSIRFFGARALSIMTLDIITVSIMTLSYKLLIRDPKYNHTLTLC